MVGTQTGKPEEYEIIKNSVKEGTVVPDDANPAELEKFMKEKGADILVGGVKERPLAYKLGVAFCNHNHERKHALAGVVRQLEKDKTPNGKINIIPGNLNPGDIRNIKQILDAFKIDYILFPDISDTFDAPYRDSYNKLPAGGTKVGDIKKMAGASATVEMGCTVPESISPGE